MKKTLIFCILTLFGSFLLFAKEKPGQGIGADAAFPEITKVMQSFKLVSGEIYIAKDTDVEKLFDKAAEIKINMLELLDCMNRYMIKNNFRVRAFGTTFRNLSHKYKFCERTKRLMALEKLDYLETGAVFNTTQNAMDMWLFDEYSTDLELGTGYYQKHFGFKKIEPLFFLDCFGLKVKVWGMINKTADKIHLYDRGKASFFVKGFYRGKHWHINLIEKLN